MADTIQRQIIAAIAAAAKAGIHDRQGDIVVIDGGNGTIADEYGIINKVLSVTIEAKTFSTEWDTQDDHATLMDLYGQIYNDVLGGDTTLGGLASKVYEAATSPELEIRDAGGETIGLRVNLEVVYRHAKGDPFSLPT